MNKKTNVDWPGWIMLIIVLIMCVVIGLLITQDIKNRIQELNQFCEDINGTIGDKGSCQLDNGIIVDFTKMRVIET